MKSPILGQSYVARSVNAACDRMVNLFLEAIAAEGKEPAFLQRAPGLSFLQTIGTGPIRGLWTDQVSGAFAYVVSGGSVYKIASPYATPQLLGAVSGTGPVSIADNANQIFFACNPNGFIYDKNTGAFGQISDPDFPGAVTVAYLDGYFAFNEPSSQKIWITALLDGTSIDPLDFASAEGSPDGVVAIAVDHKELWVFGSDSIEVWYDAGTEAFPLVPIQGAFTEIGCVAPYSVAKLDNGLFWLGTDARGQGIVYRSSGYSGVRVSTHAVEWQIQQYPTLADAVAYTYQQDGHSFYVLNFPTANTTWVYDAATQMWAERAGFALGNFVRHRANNQCNFAGQIIVGDFENGNIYTFDLSVFADNGSPQKWLRSWRALPTGANNLTRTAQHSLQLDCETGVGLNDAQGSDPQVILEWSDDGGHTWSDENWRSMGPIGGYGVRAIWRRLGMTTKLRDRVYRISGTDPVRVYIMGAELIISPTTS